jgi:hypothetical protein
MGPWRILATQHQLNHYETNPPLEGNLLATIITSSFDNPILINATNWNYKLLWIQLADFTRYSLRGSTWTLNYANLRINTSP